MFRVGRGLSRAGMGLSGRFLDRLPIKIALSFVGSGSDWDFRGFDLSRVGARVYVYGSVIG